MASLGSSILSISICFSQTLPLPVTLTFLSSENIVQHLEHNAWPLVLTMVFLAFFVNVEQAGSSEEVRFTASQTGGEEDEGSPRKIFR